MLPTPNFSAGLGIVRATHPRRQAAIERAHVKRAKGDVLTARYCVMEANMANTLRLERRG